MHKSSRRGKLFKCKSCGFSCDADLNAAMNHKASLCGLPTKFSCLPNKSTGFYWKSDGLFDVDGSEIIVPVARISSGRK